jgi:hypothetical protein
MRRLLGRNARRKARLAGSPINGLFENQDHDENNNAIQEVMNPELREY